MQSNVKNEKTNLYILMGLSLFSTTAVTDNHKFSDVTQPKFIIL